jgi:hypothetical protein
MINGKIILVLLAAVIVAMGAFVGVKSIPHPLGALSTPDFPTSYYGVGGVRVWKYAVPLTQATTTPCNIQSPAATSTLGAAGIQITVSSSTATTWTIAKSTTPNATTTAIGTDYAVSASASAFIQASSSPAAAAVTVLAPNTWIVFGAKGGITSGDTVGTGFVPTGTCHATFEAYL